MPNFDVAANLRDEPVLDVEGERRGEDLPCSAGRDAEERFLLAGARRTHDDPVALGDDVDWPCLWQLRDLQRQSTPVTTAGGIYWSRYLKTMKTARWSTS
jgi:hypothetical protein